MKYTISFVLSLFFLSLYGQVTIIVLGSSTAVGIGVSHPDSAWVNRYRSHLQAIDPDNEVINLARGGYTTFHILPTGTSTPSNRPDPDPEKNISAALSENPDAIIINLPSNDAAFMYPVSEQLANYETVMALADEQGVPIWISTPQPRGLNLEGRENLMEMRDSTHAIYGEKVINFWTTLARSTGSINIIFDSGDGVHLNDRGHKILFERVVGKNILTEITTDLVILNERFIKLNVFPNPAKDVIYLIFEKGLNTDIKLQIRDITGNLLETQIIHKNTISTEVDIHHLPFGMYQLIFSNEQLIWSQLIVKN